ncbi:hypothetical protein BGZ76_008255 [Entomortierella beljakovae]|nr:hypothetical protein BGZ76_008255 [Entomortierella beljakovae]
MRFSIVLSVVATLLASVSAHDGPHDPPTTAPTGCLATPTNSSCSSFTIPDATLTGAIDEICKTSSFLPGCSLNTACKSDPSLNATYCAPLTVLASLCTAAEDTNITSTACAKSYSLFCSKDSLIPACKTQLAFPGLPSGKIVTGTVYSICQDMPSMTDCKICPGPDATGYSNCDEVKAWKGLCLDMPDMTQCPSFNTMCNSTKFAPFCSSDYKAPGGVSTPTSGAAAKPTEDHSTHGNGANTIAGSLVMSLIITVIASASAFVL